MNSRKEGIRRGRILDHSGSEICSRIHWFKCEELNLRSLSSEKYIEKYFLFQHLSERLARGREYQENIYVFAIGAQF